MTEAHANAEALTRGRPVTFGGHEYVMSGGAEALAPASPFVDLRRCDGTHAADAVRIAESVLTDDDGSYVIFRRPGVGRDSARRADCVPVRRID